MSDVALPTQPDSATSSRVRKPVPSQDRSRGAVLWYRLIQWFFSTLLGATHSLRVTGRENLPETGAVMLVSNHLSHLDVLVLGILLQRPLNFVARSTLFFPPLGFLIRTLGAFPIQRDGIGAQGLKETLKRLRGGGIVTLFPEGTRTPDGNLGEMKAGIALLATKAKVAIVPAAIAGTFESWPRTRSLPVSHPLRVHFGSPIPVEQVTTLPADALNALIRSRVLECQRIARTGMARDLDLPRIAVGDPGEIE